MQRVRRGGKKKKGEHYFIYFFFVWWLIMMSKKPLGDQLLIIRLGRRFMLQVFLSLFPSPPLCPAYRLCSENPPVPKRRLGPPHARAAARPLPPHVPLSFPAHCAPCDPPECGSGSLRGRRPRAPNPGCSVRAPRSLPRRWELDVD